MRGGDLFRLSFSALRQQKTRTALTSLGVALGTCMLAFSLSIGQGVQDALDRQFRRNDNLRRVQIYGGRGSVGDAAEGVPPEALDVHGRMSEEKRKRIRQKLALQWHGLNTRRAPVPLTMEVVERLRALPHVESALPEFGEQGRFVLGDRSISTFIRPAPVGRTRLPRQLVAGSMPPTDDRRAVLVHEFLLYQLGVQDDDAVERALGRPIRLQLYNHYRSGRALLNLLDAQATTLSADEIRVLEKTMRQLPDALEKVDLTAAERETLRQLIRRRDVLTRPLEHLMVAEEFTLAGVFRDLTEEEEKSLPFYEHLYHHAEVVVPTGAGVELCQKLPRRRDEGYDHITLVVDRKENVRGVVNNVRAMGLQFYSAVDWVEQVLREVKLIRFATSFIAAVALLVAGLGITNTMVTGVLERTREIGIMKAVGARDRHIQAIFLIEGTLLGLLGSALGMLAAWLLSIPGENYARKLMEHQMQKGVEQQLFVFPVWLLLSVPLFVMLVTTLAAVYPARRAARVDPIVALRHE